MKTLRLFILTLALLVFTPIVYSQDYDFYLQKARQRIAEGDCDGAQRSYNVYKEMSHTTNNEIELLIKECEPITPGTKATKTKNTVVPYGYVDLGLPSGTYWKDKNENGYYEKEEAIRLFGGRMPTREQFEELITYCEWSFSGWGVSDEYYRVTGPNGNSIVLPLAGEILIENDSRYGYGQSGTYWSSTKGESGEPYKLSLYREYYSSNPQLEKDKINIYSVTEKKWRNSVRLVFD